MQSHTTAVIVIVSHQFLESPTILQALMTMNLHPEIKTSRETGELTVSLRPRDVDLHHPGGPVLSIANTRMIVPWTMVRAVLEITEAQTAG